MPELKTVIISSKDEGDSLAAGATAFFNRELVAEENMHIVGFMFYGTLATNVDINMTVLRSGTGRIFGAYAADYRVATEHGVLSAFHSHCGATDAGEGSENVHHHMLPSGTYFFVEKGERIYFAGQLRNNDSATHTVKAQVCIYYY